MIYLRTFQLSQETVRDPYIYPYNVFAHKECGCFLFDRITILYGNNASGKSTMLNLIAHVSVSYTHLQGESLADQTQGAEAVSPESEDTLDGTDADAVNPEEPAVKMLKAFLWVPAAIAVTAVLFWMQYRIRTVSYTHLPDKVNQKHEMPATLVALDL